MIVPALVFAAVVSLGNAESFSILAGSGVRATGTMRVTGNVGAPATGIVPAVGQILPAGDALKDVAKVWDELASSNDVLVFRIDGDLTTLPNSSTQLPPGTKSSEVFWLVSGSATLGEGSSFVGTLIAMKNITVREGVTVSGRLFARQGTVTLTTDDINFCCEPIAMSSLPTGTVNVPYSAKIVPEGNTFSLFSGSLPPGFDPLASNGTLTGKPTLPGTYKFIVMAMDYQGCSSIRTYTLTICGTTDIEPASLPDATVGEVYSQPITASGLHLFSPSALPDGLSLTPATCATSALLSGPPTKDGLFKFTITATTCDGFCSGSRDYTLRVCPLITFVPPVLDGGTVGTPYKRYVFAVGGTAPYHYDPSNVVSVPTLKPGSHTSHVKATDANGCSGTQDYVVNVGCPPITILPDSLPTDAVSVQLRAVDLAVPYTFTSPQSPTLVTIIGDQLSWAATPPGDYSVTVVATHNESGCTGSRTYTLHIPPPCPLTLITLSPTTLSRATLLVPYSKQITIAGGSPPYTITPASVSFLTLSPEVTADGIVTIAGTPMMTGVVEFTVTATDANGCIGMQKYHIAVDPPTLPGPVVPTLSEWMLAMLAIVLAGVGLVLIRRGE